MGENSGIQWTDHTFNIVWGCVEKFEVIDGNRRQDPACQNCYARSFAKRVGQDVWGADKPRRVLTGAWSQPAKWNREAKAAGKRAKVFCSSMADVFEDHPTVAEQRERLWPLIHQTPWLDWQLLTKRPENIMGMVPDSWRGGLFPDNVWIGTTVADQPYADLRIPILLAVPARVRFLSVEPMLGPIDLSNLVRTMSVGEHHYSALECDVDPEDDEWNGRTVNWIIIGGESGPKARPLNVDAAADLVQQCRSAGVPVFVKQFGERWARDSGTHHIDSHGGDPSVWPSGDWPREMPA